MTDELSRNERIKEASDYLRGTLEQGLREEITGAIIEDDAQLVSNLVWAGGARLVRDVWVAGEQVLADGEPTRVDRAATTADVRAVAARIRG